MKLTRVIRNMFFAATLEESVVERLVHAIQTRAGSLGGREDAEMAARILLNRLCYIVENGGQMSCNELDLSQIMSIVSEEQLRIIRKYNDGGYGGSGGSGGFG